MENFESTQQTAITWLVSARLDGKPLHGEFLVDLTESNFKLRFEEKKNRDKRTGEEKRKKEREEEVDERRRRGIRRGTLQLYQVFKSLIFILHFNRQQVLTKEIKNGGR
ncbi:hypothetical protein LWI28_016866 [Acer negundo]|uniref:Uncharacterized protein n=1 Tax=Acer negundo TaxID=4023 RepID=A0AAD5NE97_ACENE|nr:hypothetical protein LWI28_016866 [Acer negundo]